MKPTWWKPLGVIGGLLLIAGILIFVLTKGSIADIVGGCVIVAGILSCVLFFTMKQNASEAEEAVD